MNYNFPEYIILVPGDTGDIGRFEPGKAYILPYGLEFVPYESGMLKQKRWSFLDDKND